MTWQSDSINPTTTSPAEDIGKIKNDLQLLRSVIGGGSDPDVPVEIRASALAAATWASLSSLTGTVSGQDAEVLDTDTGTHTDPVVGGTVANAGKYSWSTSPAGWKRIGATGLAGKLNVSAVLFPLYEVAASASAAEGAALARVERLELFGADPSKFYSVKYIFWKDIGTRFNLTIQQHTDSSGTGAVDVCGYVVASGADTWTGRKELTLAAMGGSGITGTAVIDFTTTTAMTVSNAPSTAAIYQRRALATRCVTSSASRTTEISSICATVVYPMLGSPSGKHKPFVDNFDKTSAGTVFPSGMLSAFVKNVWVYGARKEHEYRLGFMRLSTTATCYIDLYDTTDNRVAARWTAPTVVGAYTSQPRFVRLTRAGLVLTNVTGEYAVLELDWSAAQDVNGPLSTQARGGVHADCIYSDEMLNEFLHNDVAHEIVKCGPARTFTTLRAAIQSLYDSGTTCYRAHFAHQIEVQLDPGTYNATNLVIPDWVHVSGAGRDKVSIEIENTTHYAMLQAHLNHRITDVTIKSDTGDGGSWGGEYCIHSDDAGLSSFGGTDQRARLRQVYRRLRLVGGVNHNANLFGGGFSSGEHVIHDDVILERLNPNANGADLSAHNTPENGSYPGVSAQTLPVTWELINCRSSGMAGAGVQVISLGSGSSGSMLKLTDCNFDKVARYITTAPGHEWTISGNTNAAIVQSGGVAGLPDTGYNRKMTNSTGGALVAGRFVKRTGTKTIDYAGPGDRVFGWLAADIASGAIGDVVTSTRISGAHITGASSGTGEFGLAASGLLDFSATAKVGQVYGGVVYLY